MQTSGSSHEHILKKRAHAEQFQQSLLLAERIWRQTTKQPSVLNWPWLTKTGDRTAKIKDGLWTAADKYVN